MKNLSRIFSTGFLGVMFPLLSILGSAPITQSGPGETPTLLQPTVETQATVAPTLAPTAVPTVEISFTQLGYKETSLHSPYSTAEFILRLPEDWQVLEGSILELDLSYTYFHESPQDLPPFSLLGDIIVTLDGQTLLIQPITEPIFEHARLRIELPPALLNDPARRSHNLTITLDANLICDVPHKAQLLVHPTSSFSLAYESLSLSVDLSLYPRPFYQRSFEPDAVRFVLPSQPTPADLTAAAGIAARLGDLTYGLVISATTDAEFLQTPPQEKTQEHLIVVGRPGDNALIAELNRLEALPAPLHDRQLKLSITGPASAAPGDRVSYTFTLSNTTPDQISDLSLINALPDFSQLENCTPACTRLADGEVRWSVSRLNAEEVRQYHLTLRLSQALTQTITENTLTLLDAAANPINGYTLTTVVGTAPTDTTEHTSTTPDAGLFFSYQGRAIPANDGVVQELVSPWNHHRAILIITGLNEKSVGKAGRAMSFENSFPGPSGALALVKEARPLLPETPKPKSTDIALAELGYASRILTGYAQEINYYFDMPLNWRLTEGAFVELHFTHAGTLDYRHSSINVQVNGQPIATIALDDETALNGELKALLSPSQINLGTSNRLTIQTELHPFDVCSSTDVWLRIDERSLLHLEHQELSDAPLSLSTYPAPFDQRSDLADLLFVLPAEPVQEEWANVLTVAAALGSAAGGPNLAPAVTLGDGWAEMPLEDYHLVVIGRPTRNTLLQAINADLPQPFVAGSDVIEQQIDRVVLRLPANVSLGYVQIIPSSWNPDRALLALTGTTDRGVGQAAWALINQPWNLRGNLALIRDGKISTLDTRLLTASGAASAVVTAVPEMTLAATPTVTPSATPTPASQPPARQPPTSERPSWLVPLIGGTALTIVVIFGIALWQGRHRKRDL